jgi:hypothetical protein
MDPARLAVLEVTHAAVEGAGNHPAADASPHVVAGFTSRGRPLEDLGHS